MQSLQHLLRNWLLYCTALLIALAPASAQNLHYLSHQSWSTEEGLPQISVHSIVQTNDGYLWIATEGGLVRFDGITFRIFDRSTEPAFTSDNICCLAVAQDALWIGTADGILRFHNGLFHRLTPTDSHPSLVTTNNNHWTFSTTTVSSGPTHQWTVGHELPAGRIQTVYIDREGLAWVGMNSGLFVLNAESSSATPVTPLSGNSILSIYEDAEGNHWIGTETSGLHVLRSLTFRSESALAGQPITSVTQTKDGSIWIATRDNGLRRARNGVLDQPIPETALTSAVILCLAPGAHGGLWVGTPDGLNYISESNAVQRITSADGLPDDYIRALAGDPDGSVWVGTRQGLAHLHGVGTHLKPDTLTTTDGLGGNLIGSLLLTPDGLWVATSGGLSIVRSNRKIRNLTTSDGLGANIVTAMMEDHTGHLWAATSNGGLSYFNGKRFFSASAFQQDLSHDGNIEGITQDRLGFLWLRMDHSIRRIALAALQRCVGEPHCTLPDGAAATYGLADGLPNDEVVAGEPSVGWLTSNGELWFPTRGGAAIVDTEHLPSNTVAPPVLVQRFLVDDISEPLGSASLKIPFGHARFTLEYAGLSFTAPSEMRYRFRLEGFDKHWTEAGNRRSATYTNLTPGTYVFRVQAMNNEGVWNRTGAELRFRIIAPIYRRWWFMVLVLLLLLALLAGRYLLWLRKLQSEFDAVLAERNRMTR